MNLVLVGYRGVGKTVVSKILAERLDRERVGMDEALVERFGKSVPEYVEEKGWEAFRDAETALSHELSGRDRLVVDCGGGVVTRDENIEALRKTGRIVWLQARVETIAERIGDDDQRPSLTGAKSFLDEIEEVLTARLPLYEKASDFQVTTDDVPLEEIVDRIEKWFERVSE